MISDAGSTPAASTINKGILIMCFGRRKPAAAGSKSRTTADNTHGNNTCGNLIQILRDAAYAFS